VADVLIYADSLRSPEMRHEVPLAIPDAFLYAERNGERHLVASSFELDRVAAVAPELDALPYEEFGIDELYAQGLSREEIELEVILPWPTTCGRTGSRSRPTGSTSSAAAV
jgi:Xaa-Pro aminopeptidase